LAALAGPPAGAARATATAAGAAIDGISDQSLPVWDGSFASSPLAELLENRLQGPFRGVSFARYVLQWNAPQELSGGPSAGGDYRERFEAWLTDVGAAGLEPVLALTSYDSSYPSSTGAYVSSLQAVLGRALALGHPIAYVEPWNEPNDQGRLPAARAAELADAANALCVALRTCDVVAGDLEDAPQAPVYEHEYEHALTFTPAIWGVHPYRATAQRREGPLLGLERALPGGGAGTQVWFTEVGAFYCRHGDVLGQASQAAEAAYLRDSLLGDPALAPAHAFYYGVTFADGRPAPCSAAGGDDSELYAPGDRPRAAARVLLGGAGAGPLAAFGPLPGG